MSSSQVQKLRDRADKEAAAGRLWRAKELLAEALGKAGYDPDLFEQYGSLLLAMSDTMEAGQWLFVSGRRRPEYEEAIALYLGRHGRRGGRKLYESLPPAAQLGPPDRYPPPLCGELRELGVPDDVADASAVPPESWLAACGCGTVVVFCIVSGVVGAVVVLRWVVDRVVGLFG